jgi:glutamate formiminotransferase/formiminotetrahydrofolate cyclodeaminase
MRLVECVPNFSEGSDRAILDAISAAIAAVEGVRLLDVDPGAATNRTVFTFVGPPDAAQEAAFQAIRVAAERIDMRSHRGEHARLGATDVCPFVPLQGTSMEDCVALARALGERVGVELEIPVYLYEEAATRPERRNLATIRAGEYEGLEAKLRDPAWKPDFGPRRFNARAGASVIGAREFLVAYNINLNTRDKKLATDIALDLREAGRNQRGPDGKFVRDENGIPIKRPGRFQHVKAVGWYIEEYARAQISINFTNIRITPVHEVFDAACEEATKRGLRVTGSELVGLVPRDAMLAAGRHYLRKQRRSSGVPESELIHIAVR